MTIWIILLCIIALAVVVFLAYGYSLPARWRIETTMLVPANADALFEYLIQIRNWEEWTIWNRENESKFEFSYEGPVAGAGATQVWKAKRQSGRTQIRSLHEGRRIALAFVFGHSQQMIESSIELRPRGSETEVAWSATGDAGDQPSRRIMARMFMPYMRKDFALSLERLAKMMGESGLG